MEAAGRAAGCVHHLLLPDAAGSALCGECRRHRRAERAPHQRPSDPPHGRSGHFLRLCAVGDSVCRYGPAGDRPAAGLRHDRGFRRPGRHSGPEPLDQARRTVFGCLCGAALRHCVRRHLEPRLSGCRHDDTDRLAFRAGDDPLDRALHQRREPDRRAGRAGRRRLGHHRRAAFRCCWPA